MTSDLWFILELNTEPEKAVRKVRRELRKWFYGHVVVNRGTTYVIFTEYSVVMIYKPLSRKATIMKFKSSGYNLSRDIYHIVKAVRNHIVSLRIYEGTHPQTGDWE